jgi:prepilin signal peptidase PulO-like enzyme (type II secretory pathway)
MNGPFWVALAGALVCTVTDLRTGCIFDRVTAPTLGLTLLAASLCGSSADSALGACVASGLLLSIFVFTGGHGLGMGDVKLAACLGAGLGTEGGVWSIAVGSLFGSFYGAALLSTGRAQPCSKIPFGPFLAAGFAAVGVFRCFR